MPITNTIQGDLVKLAQEKVFDVIVHGCNCRGIMGAGIAPQIANTFTGVREADYDFPIPLKDKNRLGKYSKIYSEEFAIWVVNAYTQFDITGRSVGRPDVGYHAIAQVFKRLNQEFAGKVIGIPRIGSGLAGGHWEAVKEIINLTTPDLHITLVEYKPYTCMV